MTSIEDADGPSPFVVGGGSSADVIGLLDRAVLCLGGVWASTTPIVRRLHDLRERLRAQHFQLAVLGQFKRGKSTFLNALLGEPLLPTGVVPLTSIPTFIAWGPKPLVRVTYRARRDPDEIYPFAPDDVRGQLFNFVAEEANPRNRLGVARIDLFCPAAILKDGVVLIDTPGVGSTYRHNTDAAFEVLPECDAALFVVSPDPPITEAELTYLDAVRSKVARVFFVLNKADYLEPPDLQATVDFLRKTLGLTERADVDARLFCVSALRGLKAKQHGDVRALETSGIAAVEAFLVEYLTREKMAALRSAVVLKAFRLIAEGEADLALGIRALEMPAEDLERRRATLEAALGRMRGEERIIRDLLGGDRRRVAEQLEALADRLRRSSYRHLMKIVEGVLSRSHDGSMESVVQAAVAGVIPGFFDREMDETSREFSRAVEEILAGHHRRIDDLVNLVRRTAADLFDIPYAASAGSERFQLGREPYWVTQQWNEGLVSVPLGLFDRFLSPRIREARLRTQLGRCMDDLVQRNVENLRWATLQRVDETFRRFTARFEERLVETLDATQGAVAAVSSMRTAASERASEEIERLRHASSVLAEVRVELAGKSEFAR